MSIMTPLMIIALIIVVIAMKGVLRTRGIPLVSLGFLWKSSKNNLGKPLAFKLASRPMYLHLVNWTKRRPSTVTQLVFIPKRVNKGLAILGHGTRSQTSLTLGCPSVENGAVILVLE